MGLRLTNTSSSDDHTDLYARAEIEDLRDKVRHLEAIVQDIEYRTYAPPLTTTSGTGGFGTSGASGVGGTITIGPGSYSFTGTSISASGGSYTWEDPDPSDPGPPEDLEERV